MLTVRNLEKDYPTRSGSLAVLKSIQMDLKRGEAIAIMGPSGSGKSTLLHILGTLDRPSRGEIKLENQDPFTLSDAALAKFRNRRIGFIFQDHHLLPQCSMLENVLIPTLVNSETNPEQIQGYAETLLRRVGLGERLHHRPAELSGGERQRVAVARSLIHKPLLLLADEPTGNLDRKTAQAVGQLLMDLHQQEQTILIAVTHSLELAKLFPRRFEMVDGTLQAME